jgi:heptosyltransferase III
MPPDGGLMHFAAASPGGVVGMFADNETLSSPARWKPREPRAVVLPPPRAVGDLDDDAVFGALAPLLQIRAQ